jgi:hypothetical protein
LIKGSLGSGRSLSLIPNTSLPALRAP